MNSNKVAKMLTDKLKRKIRVGHLEEVAISLGKTKTIRHSGQTNPAYYWNESEIEIIMNKI